MSEISKLPSQATERAISSRRFSKFPESVQEEMEQTEPEHAKAIATEKMDQSDQLLITPQFSSTGIISYFIGYLIALL